MLSTNVLEEQVVHIEGIASQNMSYLTQFFAFVNTGMGTTKAIPSFNEYWGYINKFNIKKQVKGAMEVAGEYSKVFPFTIVLPDGLEIVNNKIVEWSSIKEKMIKLQEEEAKIKEFFDNLTPGEL